MLTGENYVTGFTEVMLFATDSVNTAQTGFTRTSKKVVVAEMNAH